MTYVHVFAQTLLDTIAMYLLCSFIAKQPILFTKKAVYWMTLFQLFCFITRLDFTLGNDTLINQVDVINYDLLPVNSIMGMVFLLFTLLILNSLFFKLTNVGVSIMTALAFIVWILLRLVSISIVSLAIAPDVVYYDYAYRGVTVAFAIIIYTKLSVALLNPYIARKSTFTKVILMNTFIAIALLIAYANFNTAVLLQNILYITIGASFVVLIHLWMIIEQKNATKREKRVEVIEHYLPVIDELVSEVRARQHEFDNKLLAIMSILETSEDLASAKESIQKYTHNVVIEENLKEVLLSDNKVIAGFLYTKVKLAALKKIQMKTEIHTNFQHLQVEEYEIVEVLGILLDNAIEACQPYDEIYVLIHRKEEQIEIKVSNPSPFMSNKTFLEMFERGYTTKNGNSKARGFGLFNVKQIVIQHGGKIITKNIEKDGKNYVTIGVQLP